MSYEQIYDSLSEVFNGFFNQVFNPFIDFVRDTPLLSVGLMVSALPLVLIVVDFFFNASHDSKTSLTYFKDKFTSVFNKTRDSVSNFQKITVSNKRNEFFNKKN